MAGSPKQPRHDIGGIDAEALPVVILGLVPRIQLSSGLRRL
jgi:hypothetical protein